MPKVADRIYPKFVEDLPSLGGKCVAITGTTSGTGFWAAQAVIKKGASAVLLLNRKSERAVAADAELTRAAETTQVISVECDLKSFASVASNVHPRQQTMQGITLAFGAVCRCAMFNIYLSLRRLGLENGSGASTNGTGRRV